MDSDILFQDKIQTFANFLTQKLANGTYQLKTTSGEIVGGFESVANFIAANINTGSIVAKDTTTNSFTSFQATIDNLLIKGGLVSPQVKTALISPLPNKTDVTVQIGKTGTSDGKFAVKNTQGDEVASIDTSGNATFSGTLESDNVKTNDVVAGKIYADEIVARNGYFSNLASNTNSGVTLEEIENLLKQAEEDQKLLNSANDWSVKTSTSSANLDNIAAKNLYVTGATALNSLSVTSSISLGTDLVFESSISGTNESITSSINTLTGPLQIQSLALAPVEIMNGLVRIETNGDVAIGGNLFVAGNIDAGGLTLRQGSDAQTATQSGFLKILGADGTEVGSVDASGSAKFNSLETGRLVVAGSNNASQTINAQGEIETNAIAGVATLKGGETAITIRNSAINSYTLVYVTPTSTTQNKVLYVKSKGDGFFTAGFSSSLPIDVEFNWWVVEVGQ